MTTLLDRIKKNKQHGDVARIARVVNARRKEKREETITRSYVGMMLDGHRTMTDDVREVASKYFDVQVELKKELIA